MNVVIQSVFFVMTATGVVFLAATKNIVYATYSLALVLISTAGLYVFLQAELMAVVQILLYAGGIVILMLFGVMMTNRLKGEKLISGSKNTVLSLIISLTVFAAMIYFFSTIPVNSTTLEIQDQIAVIGVAFLTDHLVAFELIAFILLVALVGAAYLAKTSSHE
ncbi:MAG: NADH-quinone oxidoreductase subunit J [Bacteroidota bacterium]